LKHGVVGDEGGGGDGGVVDFGDVEIVKYFVSMLVELCNCKQGK